MSVANASTNGGETAPPSGGVFVGGTVNCDATKRWQDDPRMHGLGDLIIGFQLLEESLKQCIEGAFSIIARKTDGTLRVKLSRGDLEDSPLGRLIDQFAKYVSDEELVRELRALRPERDRYARRAFLTIMMELSEPTDDEKHEEARRLAELRQRVTSAVERLTGHWLSSAATLIKSSEVVRRELSSPEV